MENSTSNQQNTPVNKAKRAAYGKQWILDNKARIAAYDKQHYLNNKAKWAAYAKQYYLNNKVKIIGQRKQYHKQYQKQYQKRRCQTDVMFKMKCRLRSLVWGAFKRIGQNKPARTERLLGCSWIEAKAHFERLFQEGMRWDNHGEWHIDHIRPVASFKPDELHLMNHISNLQPLWAEENLGSKKVSDMVKWLHIQKHL